MRWGFALIVTLFAGCLSAAKVQPDPLLETREVAMLWNVPYSTLVIEVDYLSGSEPSKFALENLVAVAEAQTHKDHVRLLPPEEIAASSVGRAKERWTLEEVYAAHEATFNSGKPWQLGEADSAFLHVIYLDSHLLYEYRGNWTSAIGLSSRNVIWVFRDDSLFQAGGITGPPNPLPRTRFSEESETGTLLHEFGHAMGLVNNGIPMVRPHNKPNDPAHSNNPESIMSGGWDSLDEARMRLTRGEAPSLRFDDDDLADLEAFRNQQPPPQRA